MVESAVASRREASAPLPGWLAANLLSCSAVSLNASTFSLSVGGSAASLGSSADARFVRTAWISGSFSFCPSGTKLDSVMTRETSGTLASRAATASASLSDGANTPIVLVLDSGSRLSSR